MGPTEKDPQAIDVGSRLRELRMERGLSMRGLARESGLSVNALSMIERNRTSPSVSTLYKLSDALGVPITAFFRLEPPRLDIVYRKADERTRIPFTRGVWEGLGGESFIGGVEPLMLTLESGANSGRFPMIHSGHEFVMCISGQLEYEVEEQRFTLNSGDSLIFAAQLEHRWRNTSRSTTKAVVVLSGFEYGERPSEFHITPAVRAEGDKSE
jgi:transcriptional regulator with XRE-family HTH domain